MHQCNIWNEAMPLNGFGQNQFVRARLRIRENSPNILVAKPASSGVVNAHVVADFA